MPQGNLTKKQVSLLNCGCAIEKAPKFQNVFGETIVELAELNPKIVGVTPAMPSGCSLNIMMEKMPERSFDVGIAEQHAVTFLLAWPNKGWCHSAIFIQHLCKGLMTR